MLDVDVIATNFHEKRLIDLKIAQQHHCTNTWELDAPSHGLMTDIDIAPVNCVTSGKGDPEKSLMTTDKNISKEI